MRRASAVVTTVVLSIIGAPAAIAQVPSGTPGPDNPFAGTGAIPGSGTGILVGVLGPARVDAWSELVLGGIRDEAATAGATLLACTGVGQAVLVGCVDPDGDPGRPDVILDLRGAGAPDRGGACPTAGIPTIAIDRSPSRCAVSVAGADSADAGRLAGATVGSRLGAAGGCEVDRVIVVPPVEEVATLGDPVAGLREGLLATCETLPPDRVVTLAGGPGELAGAAASAIADLSPGTSLVGLAADGGGVHALLDAMRSAPDGVDVAIGAVGGLAPTWSALSCDPSLVAEAALFPERYGRTVIPAALVVAGGGAVPDRLVTPVAVLDAASIRASYPDVPACG